jgi:hypothetical protein
MPGLALTLILITKAGKLGINVQITIVRNNFRLKFMQIFRKSHHNNIVRISSEKNNLKLIFNKVKYQNKMFPINLDIYFFY